jgi:hypothetical protein
VLWIGAVLDLEAIAHHDDPDEMRVDQDLGLRGVGRTELRCPEPRYRDDRTADRFVVLRGVGSRFLRTAVFERRPQRVGDRRFESGRRQAMDGRGAAIA